MNELHRFRTAMAKHLGCEMTPETAAKIEQDAFTPPDESIDPLRFPPAKCGSVSFQVERFKDVLPELHPLHEEHWQATEGYRHSLSLDPDYAAMLAEDRAGTMLQITARQHGRLVGSLRLYIRRGRHTQTLHAVEDVLFLRPEVRGGRTAMRMVQYGERVLQALGVNEVRCTAKNCNGAAHFLEGIGYRPVATELIKFLNEGAIP